MSDTTKEAIARRLKEARRLAGLSQAHVAQLIELQRPAISEIEAGNRRVSAEELARLASIYDVSVVWLLGEVEEELDLRDEKLQLAARALKKLSGDDLTRLLRILATLKEEE
jgi:transcriptional regulator with XRE-family HTH domain